MLLADRRWLWVLGGGWAGIQSRGTVQAVSILRRGLLDRRSVALAGGPPRAIRDALVGLGARVLELDSELEEDAARDWAAAAAPLHALLYDAGPGFAGGGSDALRESVERAWLATRAVATGALIPAGAGKVLLLAPRPSSGTFAGAACAALENLARTLSVEWARYGVTAAAIAPGAQTGEADLAELVCFLVSEAGEYFDGCRLDLAAG
jgi:NAD(P)-dependent dehydrogenase (short-subunit alcohol dehydrogenase family)